MTTNATAKSTKSAKAAKAATSLIIARLFGVHPELVTEIQEWQFVFWVKIQGVGCRFVSKKAVKLSFRLFGSRKKAPWAAKVVGLDPNWGLSRKFITAASWANPQEAKFEIYAPGYYHLNGDYVLVSRQSGRLVWKDVCFQEVRDFFLKEVK